ncbi:PQQ-binding-like beta-propeller repeat protein [Halorhabdus sp. CUG00001]|uniref:outer membrane protein assembly factor BamB family protein n=1 Tax=Halorhabdus sp. CUG00001 TaxID=2600297 RepID=UPI00131C38D2|nr:PQQ-binding-like beta-propeller repeat protein [Halorhabdus sp. CUG00001]
MTDKRGPRLSRRQYIQAAGVGVVSVAGVGVAQAAGGGEIWHFATSGHVSSSPTVVDSTVFVGSWDNNVFALDAGDGTEQWRFEAIDWQSAMMAGVTSSPTVVNGTVFIGSGDGNLYALAAGVSGSSEGSRVILRTLGHHGESQSARSPSQSPATTQTTDGKANSVGSGSRTSADGPGFGIRSALAGIAGGGGYLTHKMKTDT